MRSRAECVFAKVRVCPVASGRLAGIVAGTLGKDTLL